MSRKKRIKKLLESKLNNFSITIVDNSINHKNHNNFDGSGETHILVILKKIKEKPVNRLKTHRLINNILKDEFKLGLHSLEIKII
ncbi:MAG: hypothetical protein CMI96_01970 [Pelagibacteraceae bacterium]|nr:hypothetical protein [Pelagibacteraceae bacterium]|tara:strand:- start:20037 stop:20291 length:255 start_codon:yes stop_codon:yes gene_type:complete